MAEEWIDEGKIIGWREGKKEGQQEGQIKTILRILQHRFQPGGEGMMSVEQLILRITDEADLNRLTDLALEESTLEAWIEQLATFVPSQPAASLPSDHQGKK